MLNLEKLMEQYQARSPITMERQILDRYSYPDVILLATFMRNDLERAERENLAEVSRRECYWDAMEQIKARLREAEADRDTWEKTARHHQDRIEKYWSKRVKELEARNERQAKRIAQFLALSEAGVPEKVDLIEDLEQQCAALAAKLEQTEADRDMWKATTTLHQEQVKEAEAREGKLWEALQVLFECHSEGGFVEPNEDVLKQAGQALSRPRPAILDRLERLEKVYRNYLDMETPGRVDEEIPDDKESAYGKGYKDAVFDFTSDMEQALEGSEGE